MAEKVHSKVPNMKVVDGFCGSGGIGIQFALKYDRFEANDIDPM